MDYINKSSEDVCFVKNNMSGWMVFILKETYLSGLIELK